MAYVSLGYQTVVVIAAIDNSTMNLILKWDDTVTTEALAETAFVGWNADFVLVSAGIIKSKSHQHVFYDDAFTLPTSQDAERGEHAIIVTGIDGIPIKTARLNIPFPKTDVVYKTEVGEGRNVVDVESVNVQNYLDNWTATGKLTLSDGEKSDGVIIRGKRAGTP